jgi:hypothetical protein
MFSSSRAVYSNTTRFTPQHVSSWCHRQHDTNEIQRLAVKYLQLFEEVTSLRQELSCFSRLGRICNESSEKYEYYPNLQQLVRWDYFLDNLIYNVPHLKLHLQPLVQFIHPQFGSCDFIFDVCVSMKFCKSLQASLSFLTFFFSAGQLCVASLVSFCDSRSWDDRVALLWC